MAITFPRALPSTMLIDQVNFGTNNIVGRATSEFSGKGKTQEFSGQWWTAKIIVSPSEREDAAPVAAWLTSLKGKSKTFLLGDPGASSARGSASVTPGTPLVDGAAQTGDALLCKGGPLSATGYLLEGDYVQLGSGASTRLHMVLQDVNTDGAGDFSLTLWPDLRDSPGDGDTLVVDATTGLFTLASNSQGWDLSEIIYGFSFDAVESLY